jgi:pimeloyl-ACP methyl ester carboxylesterase
MHRFDGETEERTIDTGIGTLYARAWHPRTGAARAAAPLVLLHDSLGCVVLWRDFPALLAQRTARTVVAYDRLGFGRSSPRSAAPGPGFIAGEANVFPSVLDAFAIDRFAVLGHSVGGGMAVHCAARHPSRCTALVTESAQAFVEDRTLAGLRIAQAAFAAPGQLERLARHHGDKARWVLDAWLDTWLSPAFRSWSLEDVLPHVRCPVLVLHGADDEYGSRRHPEMIAALVAGPAALEVMPDTRHVPHREREAAVIERIGSFLAGCS